MKWKLATLLSFCVDKVEIFAFFLLVDCVDLKWI